MRSIRCVLAAALATALHAPAAQAQVYGANPFANGPSGSDSAGIQRFDPDTGNSGCFDDGGTTVCPDSLQITLEGFTITGINSLRIDPTDGTDPALPANPGDPEDTRRFAYAIFKVQGNNTGRLLGLVDLDTGVARNLGDLGDRFSSLAFDAVGNLYGATGNGATVPESFFAIDKTNASKTLIAALGNGADGEVVEFNPRDNRFYHWSGNGTVVFERFDVVLDPPNAPTIANLTPIPFTGAPGGETFGATFDGCLDELLTSNIASAFNRWTVAETPALGATVAPSFGAAPGDMRGLALLGGRECLVDLAPSLSADNAIPANGDTIVITAATTNDGPARSLGTTITFTLPAGLTYVPPDPDNSGCMQAPVGVIECPLVGALGGGVLQREIVERSISATSNGSIGTITATAATDSDESEPDDDVASFVLGVQLFYDGFQ